MTRRRRWRWRRRRWWRRRDGDGIRDAKAEKSRSTGLPSDRSSTRSDAATLVTRRRTAPTSKRRRHRHHRQGDGARRNLLLCATVLPAESISRIEQIRRDEIYIEMRIRVHDIWSGRFVLQRVNFERVFIMQYDYLHVKLLLLKY